MWILALGLMACGGGEEVAPTPEPVAEEAPAPAVAKDSPEGLAATATAIAKDPGSKDAILKEAGWTAEEFEAALVALAKDPAKRAAYVKARRAG